MDARRHPALRLALLLAVLLVPSGARGQGGELGTEWQPVDPARLAQMRGGFQMPSGMMLSFGIERVVFLNGELTARIAVQIPDVARITPEQAQALADFNRGMVVQIGEGNRFNGQVGMRRGALTGRAGIVDSKLGVGFDAAAGSRWVFSADAYNINDAALKVRATYKITSDTYLIGQINDVNRSARRTAYVGLRHTF